ncbi:MAG: hypothetical protein WB622_06210 [Acidobacteriaceae bacterium]
MANHPDKPSPGEALFLAQGGADVGENDESVRDTTLAEAAAANHPASRLLGAGAAAGSGGFQLNDGLRGGLCGLTEEAGEVQIHGGLAQVPGGLEAEDAFGCGVEQAEARVLIEGKDGGVHFGDDPAQQGDSFQRGDALGLQSVGQGVDFKRKLAERVVAGSATGAEGVVLFPESGDDVGESLKGADSFFNEGGEDEEQDKREDGDCSQQRSGGDVQKGEERGRESNDGKGGEGAEDAQAGLEGDALTGGLARSWTGVRHFRLQGAGYRVHRGAGVRKASSPQRAREDTEICLVNRMAGAFSVLPGDGWRRRAFLFSSRSEEWRISGIF